MMLARRQLARSMHVEVLELTPHVAEGKITRRQGGGGTALQLHYQN